MNYRRRRKAWFPAPWAFWAPPSRPPKSAGPRQAFTRFAFTLAEILITLGIIGIVAALTMPSLIANYQKQQTVTQLKKAYSEISQAFKLAEVEHGSMNSWSFPRANYVNNIERYKYFAHNYLSGLKIVNECFPSNAGCWTPTISLSGQTSPNLNNGGLSPGAFITASGFPYIFG